MATTSPTVDIDASPMETSTLESRHRAVSVKPGVTRPFPVVETQSDTTTDTTASPANAYPRDMMFGGINDPRLRVLKPIPVQITKVDANILAAWDNVDEYGTGETMGEALDDLALVLRELYWTLHDPKIDLGPEPERIKLLLDEYIENREQ